MSSIIFTHGDCDGICAGAIAKSVFPESTIFFTNPVGLLGDLNNATREYHDIVICDIAIDEKEYPQLKEKLNDISERSNLIYIDHHPMPEKRYKASWFHYDSCSSSELAYRIFKRKLNRDMRRVAIYGAIGDFSETSKVKEWEYDWDKRTLYFYAGTLVEGLAEAGRNYDYKRKVLNALSEDTPSPEIEGLMSLAVLASQKEEYIRSLVMQKVVKLRNLAYVIDINGYMSKAAIYAASYGNAAVGVSCEYRAHKHIYDISIRSRHYDGDLNRILRYVAPRYGGSGGGHSFACGARIPKKELEAFLYDLDNALGP